MGTKRTWQLPEGGMDRGAWQKEISERSCAALGAFGRPPAPFRYVESFQGHNPSKGRWLRIAMAPGGSASLIPSDTRQQSRTHGTAMTMTSHMDARAVSGQCE